MIGAVLACAGMHALDAGTRVVDERDDYGDAPEPGLQLVLPDQLVGPYEEVIFCFHGTWDGETVGVNLLQPRGNGNHHNQLKTPLNQPPADGTVRTCSDDYGEMGYATPLFEAAGVSAEDPGGPWLDLPTGMAMKFASGTPWMVETHFINPTDDAVLVNAAIDLGFVPEEEVDVWLGTFEFDAGDLGLDPGPAEVTFECAWTEDVTLFSILGHMHEFGRSFTTEWIHDGVTETIYEVADWDASYKNAPVIANHEAGEIVIEAGDIFRTTCTWDNTTDGVLEVPAEMCTLNGTAYPLDRPLRCVDGKQFD